MSVATDVAPEAAKGSRSVSPTHAHRTREPRPDCVSLGAESGRGAPSRSVAFIDPREAFDYLLARLPGYEAFLTFPEEGHALFHPAMGDLGRYYMSEVRANPDLARTYWLAVERLASQGDESVENAVHVSLIEWFAWGDQEAKDALADAESMLGPATAAMVRQYGPDR